MLHLTRLLRILLPVAMQVLLPVLPLAPVSPFVPLFLGFLQRYRPEAKLGTYYSLVLPYPLIFLAVWLLLLVGWYLVGLPIGPGIYPRLP